MPISKRYANLLSPITIGNNIIKNRMIFPNASPHVLQGPETFPAEGFRAFYANVAKNGAAIVTIAEWNDPTQHIGPVEMDMTHMQSFDMKDPSVHNYFSQLAEEIHFHGSKLLVETSVDMPEGYSLNGGMDAGPLGGEDIDYSGEDPLVDGTMPGAMSFVLPKDMDPADLEMRSHGTQSGSAQNASQGDDARGNQEICSENAPVPEPGL